jgi:hypothetical protein
MCGVMFVAELQGPNSPKHQVQDNRGRLVSDQEVKDDEEEEATKPSTGQVMRIRAKETSKWRNWQSD